MFLITYENKIDSIFFDKMDAGQYIQFFPEDQRSRFDVIELDEYRSSVIASIAVDIHDNYRFCKATGMIE